MHLHTKFGNNKTYVRYKRQKVINKNSNKTIQFDPRKDSNLFSSTYSSLLLIITRIFVIFNMCFASSR